MSGEIKTTQRERLADAEQRHERFERREGGSRQPRRVDPLRVRMARTQGSDPEDPNDASYPVQVDEKGARLPIVFLDMEYDEEADDQVIWVPRSATPQAWLYSPNGWIPRLIDLQVHLQNDRYVVHFVPELDVEVTDGITAGSFGEVKIILHGAANDQTFNVWVDHMAGTTDADSGTQLLVRLKEGRKVWAAENRGCG